MTGYVVVHSHIALMQRLWRSVASITGSMRAARCLAVVLLVSGLLSGCATTLVNEPRNQPLANQQFNAQVLRAAPAVGGETIVALSFSGGG